MSTPEKPHFEKKDAPRFHPPVLYLGPPRSFVDETFWRQASFYQFIYSLGGLVLGLASIIGGIVLFLHGVAGASSWTAKFLGASSQISDAAPGAVLFIVGLFIIFVTRFSVKAGK
jgi:hypothetical protein